MCTIERVIKSGLLKKFSNMEIQKCNQICTFKKVIKCALFKE